MLKCKLHNARVTHSELEYDGSCAIDGALLSLSGIKPFEQIEIYNISNGERFTTYAIKAKNNSNIISVNGAAAHKAKPGDRVIICAYITLTQDDTEDYKPTLVYLNESNHVLNTKYNIPIASY